VLSILLAPSLARAQAEPAPPGYVPPGKEPVPPPPSPLKWHMSVNARLAVPLGSVAPGLPAVGWGAGGSVSRALLDVGRLRVGVGFDFGYQRVQEQNYTNATPLGRTDHFLSHMTFAALAVFDGIFGRLRPWFVIGPGLSVAQYDAPAPEAGKPPIDVVSVVPLVQLGAGLGVEIYHGIDLGLGGQLDFTFSSLAVGSPPRQVFTPGLFSLQLELGFRF